MNIRTIMKRSRLGFTLVELIVVIAILAILAGVAIPIYSKYIKKANEAADLQLLDAVNTAFAAACLENHVASGKIPDGKATLQVSGNCIIGVSVEADGITAAAIRSTHTNNGIALLGAHTVRLAASDDINTSFVKYFGSNKDKELRFYDSADDFPFKNGAFQASGEGGEGTNGGWTATDNGDTITYTNGTMSVTIDKSDIEAVANSSFGQMGMNNLMGEVNMLSTSAASIFASRPDDIYTKMGTGFQNFVTDTLGKSAEDVQAMSSQELMNAVILYTMDQSQGMDAGDIMASVLDESNTFATTTNAGILAIRRGDYSNAGQTVANVAMAYAMVLGFCKSNPDAIIGEGDSAQTASEFLADYTAQIQNESASGTRALQKVLSMLSVANDQSVDFRNYLQGENGDGTNSDGSVSAGMQDLQGYIAAMNASGSNIENLDVSALLTNGVVDEDLLDLLNTIF